MVVKLPGNRPGLGFVEFGECLLDIIDHYFFPVPGYVVHQEIEQIGDPEQEPFRQQVKQPNQAVEKNI